MLTLRNIFTFCLLIVLLTHCASPSNTERSPSSFNKKTAPSLNFLITYYERVDPKAEVANIYIEGDGNAWLTKFQPSSDPTPRDSLLLKLAEQDDAENVFYLARPCQYTKTVDGTECEQKHWTSHRFAPEVIESLDLTLDYLKNKSRIKQLNLIGLSGGGNIAALLAAKRSDVLSIRTIAGNLDHQLQSELLNVSPMPDSLNAKDIANSISHIPQIHFVGENDKVVPIEIFKSYEQAATSTECIQSYVVNKANHTKGWLNKWKMLLAMPVECKHL